MKIPKDASTGALHVSRAFVASLVLMSLWGCSDSDNGGQGPIDNAQPCGSPTTFVNPTSGSQPEEIGLRFSSAFLECLLSAETEGTWVLDVANKGADTAPFNHAFVKWNPMGHPPPMVYEVPHMDVHFHMVPPEVRETYCELTPEQSACLLAPTPDEIPPAYVPTEPAAGHGLHWVSGNSPEFMGQGFSTTLIYGSYGGDMIFIEPMVTGAYLLSLPSGADVHAVPQALAVGIAGWYPQNYELRFDEASGQYEIVLTNFQFREAD